MELKGCCGPGGGGAAPRLDFHVTVRGAAHIRKGAACQDYSRTVRFGDCAAAAVADGHGDARYFRSAEGSRMAVEAALKAIREFLLRENEGGTRSVHGTEEKMTQLKKNIILNWNRKVGGHLRRHPFREEELAPLSEARRGRLRQGSEIESAYGTTLIAAAVAPGFWFGMQIGDGDCFAEKADGTLEAVPRRPGLVANVTTSLCEPDAIDSFLHLYSEERPVSVLMSTDGVRNSFDSRESYMRFMRKVAAAFSAEPGGRTRRFLKSFLQDMTERGSGDDLSVAGVVSAGSFGDPRAAADVRGGSSDLAPGEGHG